MRARQPFLAPLHPTIIWRTGIAQVCAMIFIFAAIIPGFKAVGNIGFYGMVIAWLWGVGQQGLKATIHSPNIAVWLGLTLFLWILLSLGSNGKFSDNWRLFFHYTTLGKALLAGVCMSNSGWTQRSFTYLYRMLLLLLLLMNLRQIYLMWHYQVLFDFTGKPYEVLWQIRDCGQYIILLSPFLFLTLTTAQHKGIKGLLTCWFALQIFLLLGTGLRGAYLGFIVSLVVWLGLSYRRRWMLALFAGLGAIYASVMLFLPHDNIIYQAFKRGGSDSHRIELVWKPSWHMIKEAPVYGHGFGQRKFIERYRIDQMTHPEWTIRNLPDTHNAALIVGFAAGIPAMGLYACLLISVIFVLWRQRPGPKASRQDKRAFFPLAVLCAWIASPGVLGQTDMVRWDYFAVLCVLMAICAALRRNG